MSSGTDPMMRPRAGRPTLFPWMLVGAGALVYWTIALGIGIPSLADVLGAPRAAHRTPNPDTHCVTDVTVDGRPVAFGDCFHVRFMHDSPELARPAYTVPRESPRGFRPRRFLVEDPLYAGPDSEVTRIQERAQQTQPEPHDSIGRTAY